jgi:hypothetical protein
MAKTLKESESEEFNPSKKPERKAPPARQPAKEGKGPRKPELALQVRYRRTMRPNRTYPLTVDVPRSKDKEERLAPLIVVRAVVPGALVSPAEQRMDLAKKGERIIFFVTPLSRGHLPRARLEVFAPGQPVQELRLTMGATTQCKTWILLLLTFLIPFLLWRLVWGPNRYQPYKVKPDIIATLRGEDMPGKPGEPNFKAISEEDRHKYEGPLHGINVVSQKWTDGPEVLREINLVEHIADGSMFAYDYVFDWLERKNGVLWVFVVLLTLTLLSWLWHRCWRKGRKMFVALPEAADETGPPATLAPVA